MVIPEKKTKNAKKNSHKMLKKSQKKQKIKKTEKNQKIKKLSHRW